MWIKNWFFKIFKDPELPDSWNGTRDATKFGSNCLQFYSQINFIDGNEDCLYLNVYSKNLSFLANQPVLFWIHGGGFCAGSGNDDFYGPKYLLRKEIVLVTINYRLGVLGMN